MRCDLKFVKVTFNLTANKQTIEEHEKSVRNDESRITGKFNSRNKMETRLYYSYYSKICSCFAGDHKKEML